MNVLRKFACGFVLCFGAMIASAAVTTNLDSYVEYIQSSGTQWIDTGVIGKSTVNIAADVMVLSSAGSSCLIGERPDTDDKKGRDLRLGIWINNSYKWALNCGTIDSGWIGGISYQNSRCVVSNENGRLWVAPYGGAPTKIYNGGDQSFTSSLTLTMFFLNTSSGLDQGNNRSLCARVYGLTLHDSGVLVRNFRPCVATIADTEKGTSVTKYGLWDKVQGRFYGDMSGGKDFTAPEHSSDIVVVENAYGLQGAEPPGSYMVDGSRMFSATDRTVGPIVWTPVGYRLEKWDADNGEWVYFKTERGNSFAYEKTAENGRMRLTWLWTQSGNVRRYGINDYIQTDGLIGHFDGICNAGIDKAHASSLATWKNLVHGDFNLATPRNVAATFGADSWVANGEDYFVGDSASVKDAFHSKKFTLEMMICHPSTQNSREVWAFFGDFDNRQLVVDLRNMDGSNPLVQGVQYLSPNSFDNNAIVQDADGMKTKWDVRQYIAIVCDGNTATGYYDGANMFHSITTEQGIEASSTRIGIGAVRNAVGNGNSIVRKNTEICAVRMTAEALEDWQLEHNSAVDHARFCSNVTVVNGAIGETGENGISSAPDGDYDLVSGMWTITADDVVSGGTLYAPRLTVEKLVDGEWNLVSEQSYAYSYTINKNEIGSGRIKVAWTWFATDPVEGVLDIVSSVGEEVSNPSPGYGQKTGLSAGEKFTVTCGASSWINASKTVSYICTGWKLYDKNGDEKGSGTGVSFNYEHPSPAAYRRLEWQWEASLIDGAYAPGENGGDLVIAADARGLQGEEEAGSYTVNSSRTFSAQSVADGIFVWKAVGYKLERWNAGSGKWEYFAAKGGNSFTYENTPENGRMRLTWLWSQTGNVRRYGIDDYIQTSGLIGHFDGVYNAGRNAAHQVLPDKWINLAGNFDLERKGNRDSGGFSADAWLADGATRFHGDSSDVMKALSDKKFTLEMMISYSTPPKDGYETWFFSGDLKKRQLGVDLRPGDSSNPLVQGIQYRSPSWNPSAKIIPSDTPTPTKWGRRQYIAIVCDGNTASGYCDGANKFHSITVDDGIDATMPNVGVGGRNDSNVQAAAVLKEGAEICAMRMTAGALEDWQLEHNSAVDHARFSPNVTVVNGAIAETEENGASAVPDGDYDLVTGTWTITAGNAAVGNRVFSPRLTVEKLHDGVWVVESQKWCQTCTLDRDVLGDGRVRLTWTWGTPPGFFLIVR